MNNIYQITVRIDKLSFEDLHSTFDVIKNFWLNNYVWKVILGRYSWRVLKRILSHFHYLGHIVKGKCVITSLLFMCKICSLSIQQLSRETKHEKTFVLSINNYKEYNMETESTILIQFKTESQYCPLFDKSDCIYFVH